MRWIFMITPSGPSHKHSTGQLFEDAQGNVQPLWFSEQAHARMAIEPQPRQAFVDRAWLSFEITG
jgi:hypothetical protein